MIGKIFNLRVKNVFFYENKNKPMKGDYNMTLGTFGAGLAIIAFTILVELLEKDNERKSEEFLNFK